MKIEITKTFDLKDIEVIRLKHLNTLGYHWNHEGEMDSLVGMGLALEDNLDGKVTLSYTGRQVLQKILSVNSAIESSKGHIRAAIETCKNIQKLTQKISN